jgi:thioredoxin reductase (NADPH)
MSTMPARTATARTGREVPADSLPEPSYRPLLLETSQPGIFCVGEVRSGSIKRVATAIGEGLMAVRLAFDRAQERARQRDPAPATT